ncbi:MAG TPA: hypothetical protein VGM23_13295 [Armatimonadota bacterium]|jgi:hypothetical protein
MRNTHRLLIAVAITLTSLLGQAFPTLTGPTGLGNIPTADVVPKGLFGGAVTWLNSKDSDAGIKDTYPIGVLYGIAKHAEIGAAYWAQDGNTAWTLNGKYVTPLKLAGADWAVGAQYLDFTDADVKITQAYFVGARTLTAADAAIPVRLHAGVNWSNIDLPGSGHDNFLRGIFGVDATIAKKLTIGADYQTRKSDWEQKPGYSLVARYAIAPRVIGQLGVSNAPIFGGEDAKAFAGVLYVFKGPDND